MTLRAAFIVVSFVALAYAAWRVWRRGNASGGSDRKSSFHPHIGFTRLDGMESLSLLLPNESETNVWAEEIELFLSELVAENQSCEPTLNGIQKICQLIPPGDMLPISLAGAIYKAAGEPQRKHSSILSSVLRYRIGEEWFEKHLENYRIHMIGLTASSVHRERKPVPRIQHSEKPLPAPAMASKEK